MLWLTPVVASGLMFLACGSDDIGDTERIFVAPTWTGAETLEYELYDRELRGYCTHRTEPGEGELRLTTECTDSRGEGHRDDTLAVVDPLTLEPISAERVIVDQDRKTRTVYGGLYMPPAEVIVTNSSADLSGEDEKETYEASRELPAPTESAPDPGWYDETSLFWLMRGIPLEEGFEGRFANVNIGVARVVGADVEVEGIEEVEVPAGTFMAYSIRVKSSITNRFWVDVDAPHRVVQARLEGNTFELVSWE
jgi:hypothetical protein